MRFWPRLFGDRKAAALTDVWAALVDGGGSSKAGLAVTPQAALQATVVLACVRVLAEGIAQLPFCLYRSNGRGAEEARQHPLYTIISRRPNEWQTSLEWRETMMIHAVLTGDGLSFINRVGGTIRELIPLLPGTVTIEQQSDYSLQYRVAFADGRQELLPRSQVWHLRGPSWNAYSGLDALRLAREAIGLALATEETHARFHGNGARPGGILTSELPLKDDQVNRLREAWQQTQGGVANAMKTAILSGGLKYQQLMMTGVDAQHIETRKFQIEEVCRAFRVFPAMVGYSDKTATYASAEAFFAAHVRHSLLPWGERFEQATDRDCLSAAEIADGYYTALDYRQLLRGDAASRAAFYASGITNGWMTRNEARAEEDLNPLEGLDEPLKPLNMGGGNDAAASGQPAAGDQPAADQDQESDDAGAKASEVKVGRVLSAANEGRIVQARDHLDTVLAQLQPAEEHDGST